MVFSLKGAQGPAGPQGPPGPPGLKAIADPVKAADVVSSQSIFLNRLASTVINNPNLTKNISEQIIRFPSSISNNLADNKMFQNIIANNVVSNSSIIGKTVADKIMSDPINTKELSTSLGSQGNLLLQLSENLSNPSLPYASYLKGPSGQIANLNTSLQPIGLLCDTTGNCTTPKFGSYLNYTNGNLLFQNNKGIASFRVANDGDAWVTGFSGGQLGTYNDNTNIGAVNIKWDAEGNVIMGAMGETTANLKVGGNVYMRNLYANGFLANQTINIDTIDTDKYSQLFMHGGLAGSHSGGTGTTDGSTFTITKNGPTRTIDGGKNSVVINNYSNPIIFGDTSKDGNIFLLNNYSNYAAISNGTNWINTITGNTNSTSGNNAAIINNTGTINDTTGSLMIVGNSAGTNTDRVVTVKDKLRIGDWNIFDNGSQLVFENTKDSTQNVTFNNNLSTNKNVVNGMTIGNSVINGINIGSGISGVTTTSIPNISAGNISANNFKGSNFNGNNISLSGFLKTGSSRFKGTMNTGNVRYDGKLKGNNVDVVKLLCRDIKVNNSIRSANDDLYFRANWTDALGQFYKFSDIRAKSF